MILDRLIVALDAQTTGLTRGFDRALSTVDRAGRDITAGAARMEREIEGSMSRAGMAADKLGDRMVDVGGKLSLGITAPIVALGGVAVANAAKLDSLTRGLQAVSAAGDPVSTQLERLREVAKLPGLGFEEAIQGSINLQAVGFSAANSERALMAFGNAVATTGGGKAELDRIITQLTQMSSAGKILTADLRPIIQTSPAVATALKQLFGTINADDISKKLEASGQDFDDFFEQLVGQLERMPKVTGGARNGMENLADSFTTSSASIGDRLLPVVVALSNGLASLLDWITKLDPAWQNLIIGVAAAAAAVGPLLLALGGIVKLLPLLQAGMGLLGATGGPIILAALAFGSLLAAGLALVQNWSVISYEVGHLVDVIQAQLVDRFGGIVEAIGAKVERIKTFFADMYDAVVGHSYVPDMVDGIEMHFGRLDPIFGGAAQAIVDFTMGSGDAIEAFVKRTVAQLAVLAVKLLLIKGLTAALGIATGGVGGVAAAGFFDALQVPTRATGGPVQAGRAYLRNEHGPELFVPNTSGAMLSASSSPGGSLLAQLPPYPKVMTPGQQAVDSWWRDYFAAAYRDHMERA